MTFWCVEHLHRLPEELTEVTLAALMRGIVAHEIMTERIKKKHGL